MVVEASNTEGYTWGNNCLGWHLLKTDSLSVIKETMPIDTSEQLHYHTQAQQFFYVLAGIATFNINGEVFTVKANQGINVKPNIQHCILNKANCELEFLVISEPKSHGDRINITNE